MTGSIPSASGRSARGACDLPGDADFDRTYRRVHPQLEALARRHTQDRSAAQDLLQAAAYKAFVRWRSGKAIENLEAYLTTCLLNACMDLHRSSKRQQQALELLAASTEVLGEAAHEPALQQAQHDAVNTAFAKLSAECQELLRLRVINPHPVKEVAQRLVIAEGTVKSKCSRCLDQLGRLLSD